MRGVGLAGSCVGALCALAAYATAWLHPELGLAAAWCMALAIAITMPSAMLLGARPSARQPWLVIAAAGLAVLLVAVFGAALALPAVGGSEPIVAGLPRRLGLIIYGVGLVPFLLLPIAFARDFDVDSLGPDALRMLREKCDALRARP
ncbi:MAG: hypothetical protein ABIR59_06100 [Gemmatimonadales bacterium]